MNSVYLVAGSRPWSRQVYEKTIRRFPGGWHWINSPKELTLKRLRLMRPRYVFFLHWSWKVPEKIVREYECVGFHMTNLPYGRGGSPLQNLISRGHRKTMLSVFRMSTDLDAGPVYLKEPLSLHGRAGDIYQRASQLTASMIRQMIKKPMESRPQVGRATFFRRRQPAQSQIPRCRSLSTLYDFIRMLDADGYPRAFLRSKGFRYEFFKPVLNGEQLTLQVKVRPETNGSRA
ncbi:MAG: methionyl-tRNA formyltransferase [Candidatus Omnitrophica bacterium]|nr:methionyl-tRNA formyltransferase [Candidatus Omnitrophota bacterium]